MEVRPATNNGCGVDSRGLGGAPYGAVCTAHKERIQAVNGKGPAADYSDQKLTAQTISINTRGTYDRKLEVQLGKLIFA